MDVCWVDQDFHDKAHEVCMNLGLQRFSLVDCVSFVTMNRMRIEKAFGFKQKYVDQGFALIPSFCVPTQTLRGSTGK